MNQHKARLITKQGQQVAMLQQRREKPDDPIAEYILYLNKLYRVEAHGILDENSTIVSTYREVSHRVVVYS